MRVYLDENFQCHALPGDGLQAVEIAAFEGKCREYIEGYRYIPKGETWTREDGERFKGEMLCPWREERVLAAFQAIRDEAAEALAELIEEIYQMDLEMMTE